MFPRLFPSFLSFLALKVLSPPCFLPRRVSCFFLLSDLSFSFFPAVASPLCSLSPPTTFLLCLFLCVSSLSVIYCFPRRDLCCLSFLLGLLLLPCSPDWFSISSFLFPPTASLVDLLSLCYSPYSSYPLPCSLCLALYALCYVLYVLPCMPLPPLLLSCQKFIPF